MAKVGDIVRYLNAVGGGTIVRIKDNMAYVDDDGFETPVLLRECVVVAQAKETNTKNNVTVKPQNNTATKAIDDVKPAHAMPPVATVTDQNSVTDEETSYGDTLNVTLGIEAVDIRNLAQAGYEAYIVNDSNYFLYFTVLTKSADEKNWTTFYAGVVEPNIQLLLGEFDSAKAATFDNIAVQLISFKRKPGKLLPPVSVEIPVDTTKFYKPHCFRENQYFENKVISFDIVKDGKPVSRNRLNIDAAQMQQAMQAKKNIDTKPLRRPVLKKKHDDNQPLVVDLHITELVDNLRGLSNADMLNMQVDKFREVMDSNLRNHGRKIIFIHGKGEGVLRHALQKELTHRYKGHDVCDASFREYGYGATQVTI